MTDSVASIISATARSVREANEALRNSAGELSYMVSELEVNVPITSLELGDRDIGVGLPKEPGDRGPEGGSLRFVVRTSPAVDLASEPTTELPEVGDKSLEDGLYALLRAGVSVDDLLIQFDPDSAKPDGTITKVASRQRPGTRPIVEITVAGKQPVADQDRTTPFPGRGPGAGAEPVSVLPGIGARRSEELAEVDVSTVHDLASASPDILANALNLGSEAVEELRRRAREHLEGSG